MRRAIVLASAVCMAVAAIGFGAPRRATAQEAPGSAFGSYSLQGEASAVKVLGPDPNIEGFISHAFARLRNGPVAFGLASTAWPGRIGGNLGTLLLIVGNPACNPPVEQIPPPPNCPDLPDEVVTELNSPIRAEARNGSPPGVLEVPGARMAAEATDETVEAVSVVGMAQAAGLGVGEARSVSSAAVTGPRSGVAKATSRATDVVLAGGLVTVGSLTSTATATTTAEGTTVSGGTKALDASIAGIPVTIDREGIHLAGGEDPSREAVTALEEGLAQAGVVIGLSEPVVTRRAGNAVFSAGSLVVSWIPDGRHVVTVALGGATVIVSATPAFAPDLGGGPDIGDGGFVSSPPNEAPPAPVLTPAPTSSPDPPIVVDDVLALAKGIGGGWIALGAIGALLVGLGGRRYPVRLLEEADVTCNAETEP